MIITIRSEKTFKIYRRIKTSETSADGWNHAAAIQSVFLQRFYASGPYKIK